MEHLGKIFIISGVLVTIIGIIFLFLPRIPEIPLLPGDILIKRKSFIFYFPIVTSIIISIILTLLFHLFRR